MNPGAKPFPSVPVETRQAARKVYNIQHIYLRIGDMLDQILGGLDLSLLDPTASLNADVVFRLALVTAFQYAESLPDPIAADATLNRMDWKYALYLPIKHPGISAPALCLFRQGLFSIPKGLQEFSVLLHQLGELGLYSKSANHGFGPVEALSMVCTISRIYRLKMAMKTAFSALVSAAPDWMRANALPHWYERYSTGKLAYSIHPSATDPGVEAQNLGMDIRWLLNTLKEQNLTELAGKAEIRTLAWLWEEEFLIDGNLIRWRWPGCANCACNHLGEFHL